MLWFLDRCSTNGGDSFSWKASVLSRTGSHNPNDPQALPIISRQNGLDLLWRLEYRTGILEELLVVIVRPMR